jgi:hypothetical protein
MSTHSRIRPIASIFCDKKTRQRRTMVGMKDPVRDVNLKDPRTYTVHGLLAAGSRFTDDYSEEDAIERYLELHPEAEEAAVRADLQAEIKKYAG